MLYKHLPLWLDLNFKKNFYSVKPTITFEREHISFTNIIKTAAYIAILEFNMPTRPDSGISLNNKKCKLFVLDIFNIIHT